MKQVVIMPGGFHPFHAGHYALYKQAQDAFPGADVYVAATNDTSTRPFPFALKEKLAKLAGVSPGKFIQVKSPFRAMEIVGHLDPATTQLIFVRSEKDANKPPQAGGVKKDGQPAYLQVYDGQTELAPMSQHAYMAYLPTVEFGPGMTSATEIRTAWPKLNEKRKTALVMSLYPKTQTNPALAATVVKMLDTAMGGEELNEFAPDDSDDGENKVWGIYHPLHKKFMAQKGQRTSFDTQDQAEAWLKSSGRGKQGFITIPMDLDEGWKDKAAAAALAAGTAMAPGTSHGIAGAFPTPSHQAAMYKAAADSNRAMAAQEVERQRQANAARASKLAADTKDVERLNRVNYHGKDAPKPTSAEWDGDSDFLYLDGTQYAKASRMPISGDVPSDLTLVSTREGRQVYLWTRRSLKGIQGHYFYPAEKPNTIKEFAPDEGGGSRKFIPWPEFIDGVKQIVGKDFAVTEKVIKSTIQDRFIPHDPMEYGPTMLYSYYEARAGRNKGAVSTRGSIQVGKYYPNNTALGKQNFITSFNLLKGHPFERHFDLTFDNIYKIANIILGNTEGAYQMPQPVNEDYVDEKK